VFVSAARNLYDPRLALYEDATLSNCIKSLKLDSPSTSKGALMTTCQLAVFHHRPLSIDLDLIDNPMKLTSLPKCIKHPDELNLNEGFYYSDAISIKPNNVRNVEPGQGKIASSIMPKCQFVSRTGVHLCSDSKPEYNVMQDEMQVPFTGEAKSFEPAMFEELCQYAAVALSNSLFRPVSVDGADEYPFYEMEPICFGILSVGCFGWIASVEWIGCLYYSFVSLPFVLGTQQHECAVDLINIVSSQRRFESVFTVPKIPHGWKKKEEKPLIMFGIKKLHNEDFFVKIVPVQALGSVTARRDLGAMWLDHDYEFKASIGELHYCKWDRSPVYFQHLYKVYTALNSLLAANTDHPTIVVPTKLAFGMFEVAVYSPYVGTRDATDWDFTDDGFVNTVLNGICWLATKGGMLYIDLRPQNIRVDDSGTAYLVDYDDCVLLQAPCCCDHQVGLLFAENIQSTKAYQKFSKVSGWFRDASRCDVCSVK
jgi:hypothetical protein